MGHTQADMLEPIDPSGSAIGGLWNGPKLPGNAINEAFGSVSAGREFRPFRVIFFQKVEPLCDQT